MPSFISWVPTPAEDIDTFFELAPLTEKDVVYDLGSGDGRLVIAAVAKGAGRAVGIELNPEHFETAVKTAAEKGLEGKVSFLQADVMDVDLSEATVIVCYLFSTASTALKPKFEKELKTGTRVVMESFPVPGWSPIKISGLGYKNFYLYIMPPEPTKPGDRTYAPFEYDGYFG